MMHGVIKPADFGDDKDVGGATKVLSLLRPYRWFLLLVFLPTLLASIYYGLIASDQYQARADFVVRRAENGVKGAAGIGQLLGFSFGNSQSQTDAYNVEEYLLSQNAVAELRSRDSLVERFRRPGTDWLSRLWYSTPTPESLIEYYRKHVDITQDPETAITHLEVRAFTPADAYHITRRLLEMGEARINALNQRNFNDQISSSRKDVEQAEAALNAAQHDLSNFRRRQGDIDPGSTGKAQLGLVSAISGQLALAKSRLTSAGQFLSHGSPQYVALANQVRALEAQVAAENARLAGQPTSIAANVGDYEDLVVRKEFAVQRYAAASASYEQAKSEALKQQLYLIRIVEPEMPVKSLFPKRLSAIATIFFSLLLAYAIGWLLVAGIREHTM